MKLLLRRFFVPSSHNHSPMWRGMYGERRYVVTCVEAHGMIFGHTGVSSARVAVACTCPDFEHRVHACKHMQRVEENIADLDDAPATTTTPTTTSR